MVDRKDLNSSILKQALLSFLVFMALYWGSRFLNGESIGDGGFVLGLSIFIAMMVFVRNVLSDLLVNDFEDVAKPSSTDDSMVKTNAK